MNSALRHIFDCENPRLVPNRYTGELVQVPCGSCSACRKTAITRYVAPLIREASAHRFTYFITLSYSDDFLPTVNLKTYPIEKQYEKDFQSCYDKSISYINFCKDALPVCSTSDVQRFIKRLREIVFRKFELRCAIRYAISGDYGSTTFRPHYHGLLFFNDVRIRDSIQALVSQAWSCFDYSSGQYKSIGNIDCEPAYGAAQYVSSYVCCSDERPVIYEFRDFKPKMLHSSSLGTVFSCLESPEEIVRRGLTEITIYDVNTYAWRKTALLPNMVRKLFPVIPSFGSLSKSERLSVYRFFSDSLDLSSVELRKSLVSRLLSNKFIYDYLTFGGSPITFDSLLSKLLRVHYIVKRFYLQSSVFDCSLSEYDDYVNSFLNNRRYLALLKQLQYEQEFDSFSRGRTINDLLHAVDIGLNDNLRHVSSYDLSPSSLSPSEFDSEYFTQLNIIFNKLIKRKCNNAYLEKRPEFKQFHNSNGY